MCEWIAWNYIFIYLMSDSKAAHGGIKTLSIPWITQIAVRHACFGASYSVAVTYSSLAVEKRYVATEMKVTRESECRKPWDTVSMWMHCCNRHKDTVSVCISYFDILRLEIEKERLTQRSPSSHLGKSSSQGSSAARDCGCCGHPEYWM